MEMGPVRWWQALVLFLSIPQIFSKGIKLPRILLGEKLWVKCPKSFGSDPVSAGKT